VPFAERRNIKMEKLFLEMDDTENQVKDIRPLTEEDDLFMLKIAQKYNLVFKEGSPLDILSKKLNKCDTPEES
jgi:hypothetical protein